MKSQLPTGREFATDNIRALRKLWHSRNLFGKAMIVVLFGVFFFGILFWTILFSIPDIFRWLARKSRK